MDGRDWIRESRTRFAGWLRSLRRFAPRTEALHAVDPNEEISTFIQHARNLNQATGRVRHEQFTPRPINGRLETSVYRTSELSTSEVWELIRTTFESNGKNHAKARGLGPASAVLDAKLAFDPDGKPNVRHANIVGWHPGDKHHRKQQAVSLAAHFKFEMRPASLGPEPIGG